MQLDTTQQNQISFLCQQLGHESEQVIGYCLHETCKDNFPFCLLCLTKDDDNLHQGHKSYCIEFKEIMIFLEQQTQSLSCSNEDFQTLRLLVIKIQGLIEKNFTYKSKGAEDKLSKIILKLNTINHKLLLKKDIVSNWLECMKRKDYEIIHNQKVQIKKFYCSRSQYQLFGKILIVLENFHKSLQINYGNLKLQFVMDKQAQIFIQRGISLIEKSQFIEAIKQFDEAINRNSQLEEAHYMKGNGLLNLCKYRDAIQCYDKTIQLNPNYFEAYNNKGLSLSNLHKQQDAIQCYDKAIQLNPNHPNAYNNKGNLLDELCKYQDAIQCYDKSIQLNPKYPNTYVNKGLSLSNLHKYQDAIQCYDKAIQLNPNLPDAYISKGILLDSLSKYQDAIKCYDKVIQLNPNLLETYINKGISLQKLSKTQDAIQCFDKAIKLNPDDPDAYIKKGILLQKLSKNQDAIQCYDKAIELNPFNMIAIINKQLLQQLEKQQNISQDPK